MEIPSHRIETVRRFCVPGHTACRDLRHCAQQQNPGQTKLSRKIDDPPPADENCSNGPPNARQTAGLVLRYETGCFFVSSYPCVRCRGPPLRLVSKKPDKGGCPMGQHNDSKKDILSLQNRFTAYFLVALKRKKRDYLQKRSRIEAYESMTDFLTVQFVGDPTSELPSAAPQIEDAALMQALTQLTAKERYILFQRVLYGSEYDELAVDLNLRYNGIATAYHRIIKKLRKELKGGRK